MSKQDFINAKQWGDKATFAFHAGDATAAQWYKGLADAYAASSVRNSRAAADYANRAGLMRIAAAVNQQRGDIYAQSSSSSPPDTHIGSAVGNGSCDGTEDFCAASYRPTCDRVTKGWKGELLGADVYRANVTTSWCWRGPSVVKRKTNPNDHYVTSFGETLKVEDTGVNKDDSWCNDYHGVTKHNCLTRYQFGYKRTIHIPVPGVGQVPVTMKWGGCIGTRIYGDRVVPNYSTNSYGGTCKGD